MQYITLNDCHHFYNIICSLQQVPFSTLTNAYAIALNLWPIYIPGLIEQFLIVLLTVMKYVYDKEDERKIMELKLKEEGIQVY